MDWTPSWFTAETYLFSEHELVKPKKDAVSNLQITKNLEQSELQTYQTVKSGSKNIIIFLAIMDKLKPPRSTKICKIVRVSIKYWIWEWPQRKGIDEIGSRIVSEPDKVDKKTILI